MYRYMTDTPTIKFITRPPSQSFKNIQTDERKKAFILNLNDEICLFQCSSRADMDDWSRDIQAYGDPRSGGVSGGGPGERRSLRATTSNGFDDFNGEKIIHIRYKKYFVNDCFLLVI